MRTAGGGKLRELKKITDKEKAPDQLTTAIELLHPNCLKKLDVSRQTLRADAKKVKFYDGRLSEDGTQNFQQLLGPIYDVHSGHTFNSITFGKWAWTLGYESGGISNRVILGAQFFHESATAGMQSTILVHELFHYHTQLGDEKFAERYISADTKWTANDASVAITEWLKGGCQ